MRETPRLSKNDITIINEAFEEDLSKFERHAQSSKLKPGFPAVDLLTKVSIMKKVR